MELHPLNSQNFGIHGIAVSYYNGSSVVAGYILRQLGTNRFVVTDGVHSKIVNLAQTTAIATSLASHPMYFTIPVHIGGVIEHAARLYEFKVVTTEGRHYNWHLGHAVNGSAFIAVFS